MLASSSLSTDMLYSTISLIFFIPHINTNTAAAVGTDQYTANVEVLSGRRAQTHRDPDYFMVLISVFLHVARIKPFDI